MSIKLVSTGDWKKTNKFFDKIAKIFKNSSFDKYGKMGVAALRSATPKRTGRTANSWYYEIKKTNGQMTINWLNSNINEGVVIAVILQYGHGTRNGGYVVGKDYINPAMRGVFQNIADGIWEEVTRS